MWNIRDKCFIFCFGFEINGSGDLEAGRGGRVTQQKKIRTLLGHFCWHLESKSTVICLGGNPKKLPFVVNWKIYTSAPLLKKSLKVTKNIKMQLDVEVSPPANILSICLTLTKVTFDLNPSDLWPWPKWPDLDPCDLDLHFITCNTTMRPKITISDLVTLTYDLQRSTFGSSLVMPWPNFMALGAILFAIWIIVQWISVCIWANRALAQVGSKMELDVE